MIAQILLNSVLLKRKFVVYGKGKPEPETGEQAGKHRVLFSHRHQID
jgi:hypothetical protein